jgi:hypothetical protein
VIRVLVFRARPEVLQERVPKTFKLFPVQDFWFPVGEHHNTEFDPTPGHEPNCIRWHHNWFEFFVGVGAWRLKTKIDVQGSMPGRDHKLTFVSLQAMIEAGWATVIVFNDRSLTIFGDDNVLFRAEGERIVQGDRTWVTNNFRGINVPVTHRTLDVELFARIAVFTGGATVHYQKVMFTVEYIPSTPPTPATVSVFVFNQQTGGAVGGALVQLLSGNRIVAQGLTGADGWVRLNNVPAGEEGVSYTLLVTKQGFEEFRDAIDVKPGDNMFRVALVPKPGIQIPWQWVALGIGVIVLGGVAMAAARRREERVPPIIVVR